MSPFYCAVDIRYDSNSGHATMQVRLCDTRSLVEVVPALIEGTARVTGRI